jgi:hypothetical protein
MDLPNTTTACGCWTCALARCCTTAQAHGEGFPGWLRATRFSVQKIGLHPLGFHGWHLRGIHGRAALMGPGQGSNANAFDRYVKGRPPTTPVPQHSAASPGYSYGCPALPPEQYKAIIASVRVAVCCLSVAWPLRAGLMAPPPAVVSPAGRNPQHGGQATGR